MSEATKEPETQAAEATTPNAEVEPAKAKPARVRKAIALVKRHPLGVVIAAGAAVALVEIELAVGILTGIGATALLATKSGPEARQEVLTRSQEVLTKGKAAIERARVALASRAKAQTSEGGTPEIATAASGNEAATVSGESAAPAVATAPAASAASSEAAASPKAEEPPPTAAS